MDEPIGDRPTVLLTRHDALSILTGTKMGCQLSTGEEVWVRLATADEFIEMNAKSREWLISLGGNPPPPVTREMAEQVVRPVPEDKIWPRS